MNLCNHCKMVLGGGKFLMWFAELLWRKAKFLQAQYRGMWHHNIPSFIQHYSFVLSNQFWTGNWMYIMFHVVSLGFSRGKLTSSRKHTTHTTWDIIWNPTWCESSWIQCHSFPGVSVCFPVGSPRSWSPGRNGTPDTSPARQTQDCCKQSQCPMIVLWVYTMPILVQWSSSLRTL